MNGFSMLRLVLVVAAIYGICCAMAIGQATGSGTSTMTAGDRFGERRPPEPTGPAQPVTAADIAARAQKCGGSLLQAAASVNTSEAAGGPAPMTITAMSFTSIPEAPPRTMKKHDLVTIIIREETELSTKGTTDLKKQADFDALVSQIVKLKLGNFAVQGNAIGPNPPEIQMSGSRNFKGEGTVDRTDSFIARIQAEVLDVKPNGTLVLQARKRIKADEEEQEFTLTGVCRVEDILVDNTILSTQIHDLSLEKSHRGAVKENSQRGWLTKLLDVLSPF